MDNTGEKKEWKCFFLLVHLNINSCLNKLEELILINKEFNSRVIFLSFFYPKPWIIQKRKRNGNFFLLGHLNINSCQNKLEELVLINKEFNSHVIFLSKIKIDASYPDAQMNLDGCIMYRKDRKKRRWWFEGIFFFNKGSIPTS